MDIFSETAGVDITLFAAFLVWLTLASVVIFVVAALKGMYSEAIDGKKRWEDIIFRVVVSVSMYVGVLVLIR